VATQYAPAPLLPVGAQAPMRRRAMYMYFPTPNTFPSALRFKAALNKAVWWPWPLTCWPWKWCPSYVWRELLLRQFWSS